MVLFTTSSASGWMLGATRRFVSNLSGIAFTTHSPETANPSLGRRAARRSTYFTFDAVRHFTCLLFQTRYGAICFVSSTPRYKENCCVSSGGSRRPLGSGYYTQWQTSATEALRQSAIAARQQEEPSLLSGWPPILESTAYLHSYRRFSGSNVAGEQTNYRHTII